MAKRLKFKCWKCPKTFYQDLEMSKDVFRGDKDDQATIIVSCPYCGADGVVDLGPYRARTMDVMRGHTNDNPDEKGFQLPAVLPTRRTI